MEPEPPERPEPTEWQRLWEHVSRLAREGLTVGFFAGVHWGLRWWLTYTHLQREWWAQYVLFISALAFAVGFTWILGVELWATGAEALHAARQRVARRR